MKKFFIPFVISLAFLLRMAWFGYTGYVAEDAHITFQFARNLYRYAEFSINHGFPIYGSTTPLMTILLAAWMFVSENIIAGALLVNLIASVAGIAFIVRGSDSKTAMIAAFVLAVFPKAIYEDMQGMETPFILLFMAMSWYYSDKKQFVSGIASGLLLWTRIDTAIFVVCMLLAFRGKDVLKYIAGTTIYIPWLIFSHFYFGSIIPFTITAKNVAYGIGNPPYPVHVDRMIDYLGPIAVIGVAGCAVAIFNKKYIPLAAFFLLHSLMLILTGATFFSRYFYPLLISGTILAASFIASISGTHRKIVLAILLITFCVYSWDMALSMSSGARKAQNVRHNTLTEIGRYLNKNTAPGAKVMLEPLGYVGYYADRFMFDEVGLVTPAVVDLKRAGISGEWYFDYIPLDIVILSCGQAGSAKEKLEEKFLLEKVFDSGTNRSCYEVWSKK